MKEENRLHYSWFKHNIILFKDNFEEFVTTTLNEIEISEGGIKELEAIYIKYTEDFPKNERKDLNHLKQLMNKKNYKLIIVNHILFEEMIGYAFVYEMDNNALWLDYIAIENKFQDSGYGTSAKR